MLLSAAPSVPPSLTPITGNGSAPLTPFTPATTTLLTPFSLATTTLLTTFTLAGPATTSGDMTTSASSGTRDGGPPAEHRPEGTTTLVTLVPSASSVADVILLLLGLGNIRRCSLAGVRRR
ncbi:hypothetical protein GDO81_021562 [Engystomops pustulosus]|uniref:Uncharacterized protein n=1 Tax=Engystomops pustulosus TaxID=76066 RepID=A0AAV6ZCE5_ENGPU|nr:hypothetical protein GDO81_021562 [Engystomops pustulosus]